MAHRVLDLARRLRHDRDPLDALAAIRELRRQLDSLEEEYVRAALERGASWDAIGTALAVSRQAAHKRLAGRVAGRQESSAARLTVSP
jgi:hypothetical protein